MGMESFIARLCTQKCVYWGTPVEDGYGGKTFADPVEISCRWEDTIELVSRVGSRLGEEVVSQARVYITQDVDEQGYLYLGTLDDLDSDEETDPTTIEKAYSIVRFDKVPAMRSTNEFLRKAYL